MSLRNSVVINWLPKKRRNRKKGGNIRTEQGKKRLGKICRTNHSKLAMPIKFA